MALTAKDIPRHSIEWIVDRFHVSESDDTVRADIRRRCSGPKWTAATIKAAEDCAIARHNANRDLYRTVMRGTV